MILTVIGCGFFSRGVEDVDQASITRLLTQFVTTETPSHLLGVRPLATGIIPRTGYSGGTIEMRTPDLLNPANIDCVNYFPFTYVKDGGKDTIQGSGTVNCHFISDADIGTMHAVMKHDVRIYGTIKPGDAGEMRLLAELTFAGTLSNYLTNVPEGAFNPFTEGKPFVWNDIGPMNLNFEYKDGAKVYDIRSNPMAGKGSSPDENKRVFILHLE